MCLSVLFAALFAASIRKKLRKHQNPFSMSLGLKKQCTFLCCLSVLFAALFAASIRKKKQCTFF